MTPAEAEAFEAPRRALNGDLLDPHDALGQATSEFPDQGPGLARIRGEIRSSWIVDPADGKVPWTKEALSRRPSGGDEPPEAFDNVETRPTDERCLTASGAGAPILNSHDTNLIQIVQTRDCVVIVSEKNHDARIVRIGVTLRPGESRPRVRRLDGRLGRPLGRRDPRGGDDGPAPRDHQAERRLEPLGPLSRGGAVHALGTSKRSPTNSR